MRLLVDISALPDNAKWDTGLAKYSLSCLSGFAQLGLKNITVLCTENRKRALETLFPLSVSIYWLIRSGGGDLSGNLIVTLYSSRFLERSLTL